MGLFPNIFLLKQLLNYLRFLAIVKLHGTQCSFINQSSYGFCQNTKICCQLCWSLKKVICFNQCPKFEITTFLGQRWRFWTLIESDDFLFSFRDHFILSTKLKKSETDPKWRSYLRDHYYIVLPPRIQLLNAAVVLESFSTPALKH